MAEAHVEQTLSGWGGMNPAACTVYRPEKRRSLRELFQCKETGSTLARGLGRSYGDAAVNGQGGLVNMTRLNRFIGFDLK